MPEIGCEVTTDIDTFLFYDIKYVIKYPTV